MEWERLEISSRKLEMQGIILCKDGSNKGQKRYGPDRSRRYYEEMASIHRLMQITSCGHSPRAKHPGEAGQAGLRKHHYKQS